MSRIKRRGKSSNGKAKTNAKKVEQLQEQRAIKKFNKDTRGMSKNQKKKFRRGEEVIVISKKKVRGKKNKQRMKEMSS